MLEFPQPGEETLFSELHILFLQKQGVLFFMLEDKIPPIFMCNRDLQNSPLSRPFPVHLSAETEPAMGQGKDPLRDRP